MLKYLKKGLISRLLFNGSSSCLKSYDKINITTVMTTINGNDNDYEVNRCTIVQPENRQSCETFCNEKIL